MDVGRSIAFGKTISNKSSTFNPLRLQDSIIITPTKVVPDRKDVLQEPSLFSRMQNYRNVTGTANRGRTMVIEDHAKNELPLLNDYILLRAEPALYDKKVGDSKPVLLSTNNYQSQPILQKPNNVS